jgi:hypothetical protein
MLLGQVMLHGITVTVNWHVLELVEVSITVQDTVFVPTGKVEPDAGEQKFVSTPQLSPMTGLEYVTTTLGFVPAITLTLLEHMIVGGCVSSTITLNMHLLVLFDESTAVAVTMFVPTLNVEPLGGENVTGKEPSQLSVAVAL